MSANGPTQTNTGFLAPRQRFVQDFVAAERFGLHSEKYKALPWAATQRSEKRDRVCGGLWLTGRYGAGEAVLRLTLRKYF